MEPDLKNLARHVENRREYFGLTQMDVWQRGGPSNTTLTKIENATPPPPSAATLRKLDKALVWMPGSAAEVLRGGMPTTAETEEDLRIPIRNQPALPDDHPKKILAAAQRKLASGQALSMVEQRAIQVAAEDRELETFHERWALLSRWAQLTVSRQVDELLDQETADWVATFGLPPEGDEDEPEEAEQESQQGAGGAAGGGAGRESGAPIGGQPRLTSVAGVHDPTQYAGTSGVGPPVPMEDDDFDMAASKKRDRDLQDERDEQDEDALRPHPDPVEDWEVAEGGEADLADKAAMKRLGADAEVRK